MTHLDEQYHGAGDDEEVADGQRGQVAVGGRLHRLARENDRRQQVTDETEAADRHAGDAHQQVVEHLTGVLARVVRRGPRARQQRLAHLAPQQRRAVVVQRRVQPRRSRRAQRAGVVVVAVPRERHVRRDAALDTQRHVAETTHTRLHRPRSTASQSATAV